ncbi:hypothetical protein C8J56DRAFT_198738 [Mycena floridula]|nr:hypothetical protein C8J56DRAFT_198738 [Mycena floridula]
MPENCRLCGFSETLEPDDHHSETTRTFPAHLLSFTLSNDAPSHEEESHFRQLLSEGVQDLQNLDDRIAMMRRNLEVLVDQRASKGREVEQYKSVLHPIRRLPKEILYEIFLWFVKEDVYEDSAVSSLNPTSTNWILPRVSRHWSSVALSFARIWSTVRLTTEDFSFTGPEKSRMLEVQLQRSANHQLSISLLSDTDIPKNDPLFLVLLSTSSRWKELFLLTTMKSLESLSPLRGSLPSMTTLHVWAHRTDVPISVSSMFEFAPKLTKLFGNPYALQKLQLPFSQIDTYCQDISFTCSAHASLLSRMLNLQRIATVCILNPAEDSLSALSTESLPTRITLPFLRHASLLRGPTAEDEEEHVEHSSSRCSLIHRLTVPALKEMEITIHQSMNELRALLLRSQCSLETLSLEVHDVPDDACLGLLMVIPTLTSFTLDCTEALATKFMEDFSQSPSVVPSLRYLELKQPCGFDSTQIEEFKALRPLLSVVEIAGVMY